MFGIARTRGARIGIFALGTLLAGYAAVAAFAQTKPEVLAKSHPGGPEITGNVYIHPDATIHPDTKVGCRSRHGGGTTHDQAAGSQPDRQSGERCGRISRLPEKARGKRIYSKLGGAGANTTLQAWRPDGFPEGNNRGAKR